MAGGGSTTASAGLPAPAQSSGNTGSPKGPGSPMADQMNQMKTSDGRSFGEATGKTPGQPQPQVMPAQTATTVAPGGTSGIDPNLYKPMVSGYPNTSLTPNIPPNAGITPYNPGMSPFANQFAQGQTNLAGLGQQIGLPPGPGMPTGENPLNFAGSGQPTPTIPTLPMPVAQNQTATTATTAATPQTQPMNPNRQRDMDQHDMRNNRMDNDENEMQRPGRRYGQNEMQRPGMRYGNYMEKTTPPGIAGLNSADRMKRMQ